MKKLFQDTSILTYKDIEKKKDTKKDGAQKFYSLLVLQKVFCLINPYFTIQYLNVDNNFNQLTFKHLDTYTNLI